ncbi:xanthine dehydrogenase family protein molybdopterin-binding subunit [Pseudonocardia sp. TRM90224]|uniref:xanthine dehydrogenase family protein molybdopterin-binding subunit n=1 Tax=Pseudonocardia sp. TRM90224 TaxID=2812678 RepID=UPI001E414121|nr:xanthine dehydrogenase family protein molybdopterin-binding subunit [Pseudonocardia sp. TRM90224]
MTLTDGWVGRRVRRSEDPKILLGRGRFVDDVRPTRCLHAAFVRSPVAHATIVATDASEAVQAGATVFTAADLDPLCTPWKGLLDWPGLAAGDQRPLASGKVRHVGEPVAIVVAASRAEAEDAAELVDVEYAELPAVVDPIAALEPGGPLVHDELGANLAFESWFGTKDEHAVDAAFAQATAVVEVAMSTARHTATAMEPRGVLAEYDPVARELTVRISTQAPNMLQSAFAEILGLRENSVRMLTDEVGGAFGMKAHVYPDEIATCAASMLLGRPVSWIQDRAESLQSDTQARDERVRAAIALAGDGTIIGLRSEIVSDGGAYSVYPRSMVTEGIQVSTIMPGPYRVPAYRSHLRVAITNKAPLAVYRAVGHPVAILVMEALLDEAARAVKLDPAELRRRNILKPEELPYTSAAGHVYDSGSHRESLERLVDRIDIGRHAAAARRRGTLLGVGIACFVEVTAPGVAFYGARGAPITAHDQVEVRVEPDGTATVLLGTPGQGQGLHTTAAQVVADHLGIPFDRINVLSGDTRTMPHGTGVWASRSAVVSSGAAAAAAREVKARMLAIAAHLMEVDASDLEIVDGAVRVAGAPDSRIDVAHVAEVAHWRTHQLPDDLQVALAAIGEYRGPNVTFNNGAHGAVVEVDESSGLVRIVDYVCVEDCGVLINPDIVDGQIRGGVAQGVGGALLERLHYDGDGQLLTSTLLDYLLPAAPDLPDIRITHIETPSPTPLGVKGAGEAGAAGAPAAVHNAVNNALAQRGARVWHQPITPERVLRALDEAADRLWPDRSDAPAVPRWTDPESEPECDQPEGDG